MYCTSETVHISTYCLNLLLFRQDRHTHNTKSEHISVQLPVLPVDPHQAGKACCHIVTLRAMQSPAYYKPVYTHTGQQRQRLLLYNQTLLFMVYFFFSETVINLIFIYFSFAQAHKVIQKNLLVEIGYCTV